MVKSMMPILKPQNNRRGEIAVAEEGRLACLRLDDMAEFYTK